MRTSHICPRCGSNSQVEDTRKHMTFYVRRTRACIACGITWVTAEIDLNDMRRIEDAEKLLTKVAVIASNVTLKDKK